VESSIKLPVLVYDQVVKYITADSHITDSESPVDAHYFYSSVSRFETIINLLIPGISEMKIVKRGQSMPLVYATSLSTDNNVYH
jgi:hypothetical protein